MTICLSAIRLSWFVRLHFRIVCSLRLRAVYLAYCLSFLVSYLQMKIIVADYLLYFIYIMATVIVVIYIYTWLIK